MLGLANQYLNNTSMRIIYAYIPERQRIEFIELCSKGDREDNDQERIQRHLATSAG